MESVDDYKTCWGNVYRATYAKGKKHWRPELAVPGEFVEFLNSPLWPAPPAKVLEAGCGDGLAAIRLREMGYEVLGVDVVEEAIERARETAAARGTEVEFLCADLAAEGLSLARPSDLWVDIKVLHCLWDDKARKAYLKNSYANLRSGGILFLMGGLALAEVKSHFPEFFAPLDDETKHGAETLDRDLPREKRTGIRCETLPWLCRELEEAGFEVLRAGRAVGKGTGSGAGWGAILVARKPYAVKRTRLGVSEKVESVPPPEIRSFLKRTFGEPAYERWDFHNNEAFESRIFVVTQNLPEENGHKTIRIVWKRYNSDIPAERAQSDANLVRILRQEGLPVPEVRGLFPDHNSLLMEHCGEATLADLLKLGKPLKDGLWEQIVRDLASLHMVLNAKWSEAPPLPDWRFEKEQRLQWAAQGLETWSSEGLLPDGAVASFRQWLPTLSENLSEERRFGNVIWGDCNPKNILIAADRYCFIDFQPKRSSLMLDIVLLFAFADSPATYLPRVQAHGFLRGYWSHARDSFPEIGTLEQFLAWYDGELLWRILVYGGNLLRRKGERLNEWHEVCAKMLVDLKELAVA